jgi:ribosomal-protein-alanine N-acetyltransferase
VVAVSEYIIREFTPEDLDAVIRINRENLPENYPPFFFKLHYENFPKAFLVAESGGRVVGYIMCRVETGKLYTMPGVGKQGHIISIAVVPEMRRKGVGRSLMVNAMKALYEHYGVNEYYLEVRVSNTPAINLYTKLGFKPMKTLKGYYLDGEDAYLMAKPAP